MIDRDPRWVEDSQREARKIMLAENITEDSYGFFVGLCAHAWRAGWIAGRDEYIREQYRFQTVKP